MQLRLSNNVFFTTQHFFYFLSRTQFFCAAIFVSGSLQYSTYSKFTNFTLAAAISIVS